jgi:hypothetical protein
MGLVTRDTNMQHNNYWDCGEFADLVRGTAKPGAATSKEWKAWEIKAKSEYPFRFWMVETGFSKIQDFFGYIPDKIHNIRYYLNNRFMSKSNALTAHPRDIKPGTWCDVGYRILPCLFNELVDFIEIEKAWMHVVWDKEAREKYNTPFWRRKSWLRWLKAWRCPEAGLEHLEWEMSLVNDYDENSPDYGKPTIQAMNAREQKALYEWWTITRRNRPDAYEISGWNKLHEGDDRPILERLEDTSIERTEATKTALDMLTKLEKEYEDEDEEYLIRLIKIRNSLWT